MKPSKIAIITTHSEPNYGNKLQNYALQTVLLRMGYDVETINDARSWPDLTSWWVNKKIFMHCIIPLRRQTWHIKHAKFFLWSMARSIISSCRRKLVACKLLVKQTTDICRSLSIWEQRRRLPKPSMLAAIWTDSQSLPVWLVTRFLENSR